jgi:hypothetical protein
MPGTFLGTHRSRLVTKLAQVAGMKFVEGNDAPCGMFARDTVEGSNRLPRSPDPLLFNRLDFVVESHRNSRIPEALVTKPREGRVSAW